MTQPDRLREALPTLRRALSCLRAGAFDDAADELDDLIAALAAPAPDLLAAVEALPNAIGIMPWRDLDLVSRKEVLALLRAAPSRKAGPPKSYWMEFLSWEEEAAKQGSGLTPDQMIGAAAFRSWLVNHAPDDGRPEAPSREAGPCGEKNLPGSHPCDAPKGHAPGSEPGGHFCRYSWTSREADR